MPPWVTWRFAVNYPAVESAVAVSVTITSLKDCPASFFACSSAVIDVRVTV